MENYILPKRQAITVFFVFAFGYFLSCLLRAITATLSPILTSDFNLLAADLGLLAGGYFLGFACMQIPLGYLLDKHGKNYKISSLEQFKKNKNPSILLGSLYLIGEYKKREL